MEELLNTLSATTPTMAAVFLAYHSLGTHCGVFYESKSGQVEALHLAFHYWLKSEPPIEAFAWVNPAIEDVQAFAVSHLCRQVFLQYGRGGLPYAIEFATTIGPTATISSTAPGSGFTCATFVVALFQGAGISLLDQPTWPAANEDDRTWQQQIIARIEEHLKKCGLRLEDYVEHISALRADVGCCRFRPEEVAASCHINPLPANHGQLHPLAEDMVELLHKVCPSM